MKIFKTISVGLAVMFISVNGHIASAQDFLKGLEAADNGDYQTALIEWSPFGAYSYYVTSCHVFRVNF
ncbi:hypothetical protein N9B69_01530 [Amylibacter sp.]|nr:hypothetical protein [Amylibacter sp.]